MLTLIRARQRAADGERGATLVVVMIVMFVLMTVAVVVGALVLNTMTSVVSSRSTAQSRAAADAGLAVAVSQATDTGGYCPSKAPYVSKTTVSADSTATYKVDTICGSDQVTFRSTGEAGSGKTVTDAVYKYIVTAAPGTGADMIFFANTTFTKEVVTHAGVNSDLLSLVIPGGGFTCMADVPGNIIASGDFTTKGGCDLEGDIHVNGLYNSQQGDTHVHGDVTAVKTGATNRADGRIDKNVWVGGSLDLGLGTVGGNVKTGGVITKSGAVGGTTIQNAASKPPVLDFAALGFSWFDYAYSNADWGFAETKLAKSGSGAGTCGYFNNWPGSGWTDLTTQSVSGTIAIDARACSSLSANMGKPPTITLSHDLVLAAKEFDLTQLTIKAAPGTNPKVWFIVDDAKTPGSTFCTTGCVKNQTPDIPSKGGTIKINGTVIGDGVTAMAYTPGKINVAGMGNDTWRGTFYGGSFDYGGGLQFWGAPISLPGQVAGEIPESGGGDPAESVLGERISQVDVK